ncbi:MAG TPA: DUF4265 domain-containing protein [Candidatus Acidoferrum sp.]|jgi:hypothetical protein
MVKVTFQDKRDAFTETLWATPVESNLYRLDNSPFFAYEVSWMDTVEAGPGGNGALEFVRCVKKSGNRTVRIIFQQYKSTDREAEVVLQRLRDLGCTYEGMPPKLISINVPSQVHLGDVTDFLKRQNGLQWEYADPTYDQIAGAVNESKRE